MMTKGMEMKEADLMMVCGGDYGDCDNDKGVDSKYHIGDFVEVYDWGWGHLLNLTTRGEIIGTGHEDGHWRYHVEFTNLACHSKTEWKTASDFQN